MHTLQNIGIFLVTDRNQTMLLNDEGHRYGLIVSGLLNAIGHIENQDEGMALAIIIHPSPLITVGRIFDYLIVQVELLDPLGMFF